jgi:transposase
LCEPTTGGCARRDAADYCDRCDVLVGLDGLHVTGVERTDTGLTVTVESPPRPGGCPACGVIAQSHGRRTVTLVDTPCFGRPVKLVWRKRTWACAEPDCQARGFTETHPEIARTRALLTVRAGWWAVRQMRFEHASVSGLARQLGVTWRTLWRVMRPLLEAMAGRAGPPRS